MDLFPAERVQCIFVPRLAYKVGMGFSAATRESSTPNKPHPHPNLPPSGGRNNFFSKNLLQLQGYRPGARRHRLWGLRCHTEPIGSEARVHRATLENLYGQTQQNIPVEYASLIGTHPYASPSSGNCFRILAQYNMQGPIRVKAVSPNAAKCYYMTSLIDP